MCLGILNKHIVLKLLEISAILAAQRISSTRHSADAYMSRLYRKCNLKLTSRNNRKNKKYIVDNYHQKTNNTQIRKCTNFQLFKKIALLFLHSFTKFNLSQILFDKTGRCNKITKTNNTYNLTKQKKKSSNRTKQSKQNTKQNTNKDNRIFLFYFNQCNKQTNKQIIQKAYKK